MVRQWFVMFFLAMLLLNVQAKGGGKKKKNAKEMEKLVEERRNSGQSTGTSGRPEWNEFRRDVRKHEQETDDTNGQTSDSNKDVSLLMHKDSMEYYANQLGDYFIIDRLQEKMKNFPAESIDLDFAHFTLDQYTVQGWSSVGVATTAKGVHLKVVEQDFALCARIQIMLASQHDLPAANVNSSICVQPQKEMRLVFQASFVLSQDQGGTLGKLLNDSSLVLSEPKTEVEELLWRALGPLVRWHLIKRLRTTLGKTILEGWQNLIDVATNKVLRDTKENAVRVAIFTSITITEHWQ